MSYPAASLSNAGRWIFEPKTEPRSVIVQNLRNSRVLPLLAVAILSATAVVLWGSGASADEESDKKRTSQSESADGDTTGDRSGISSLDDLTDLPCNTASDNPGRVQLEYPSSAVAPVRIFCQVGNPKLTISIDATSFSSFPDNELITSGGQVSADPSGSICDSAELEAGTRSCEPIEFEEGEIVTLTVEPDAISTFGGWVGTTGTCQGVQSPCSFTINRDTEVSATFVPVGGL